MSSSGIGIVRGVKQVAVLDQALRETIERAHAAGEVERDGALLRE